MPAEIFGKIDSPSGTIAYWDDDPANLPSGWVVCDGNNGTPNLLGKFLRGVPDSSTAPGATGGQQTFTLSTAQLAAHDHSLGGTDSQANHNHIWHKDHQVGDGGRSMHEPVDFGNGESTRDSGSGGDHSHPISISTTGSNNSINNEPEYVKMVPVMKT